MKSTGKGSNNVCDYDTMDLSKLFDDVGLQVVAALRASHQQEVDALTSKVEDLKRQLEHEQGVISDMVSICEYEGVEISVCDHCRCLKSSHDMVSCDECVYTMCFRCNVMHHAFGCRDMDDDEVCLWCDERAEGGLTVTSVLIGVGSQEWVLRRAVVPS